MEYFSGKDLVNYFEKRNNKLSENRVRKLILQIILGVNYLHSYGIVHRDLKLENIMMSDLSNNAIPKIVDLGLSTIIGPY